MQEINYALMVVLVATVFIKDENFSNKKVHDILEAWYWAVAFSGEYDKDQNVTMINHLQAMVKTVQNRQSTEWIDKLKEYVLDAQNFSDKEFLLMEKAEDDRYPKAVLKHLVWKKNNALSSDLHTISLLSLICSGVKPKILSLLM